MPPKSKEVSKQPDKEAQLEQKHILKDVRDKAFRAAMVPCAYSVEEFVLGLVRFEEIRLKSIKLTEDEVSSSSSNGKAALLHWRHGLGRALTHTAAPACAVPFL